MPFNHCGDDKINLLFIGVKLAQQWLDQKTSTVKLLSPAITPSVTNYSCTPEIYDLILL